MKPPMNADARRLGCAFRVTDVQGRGFLDKHELGRAVRVPSRMTGREARPPEGTPTHAGVMPGVPSLDIGVHRRVSAVPVNRERLRGRKS